jgi:hypothetical protein
MGQAGANKKAVVFVTISGLEAGTKYEIEVKSDKFAKKEGKAVTKVTTAKWAAPKPVAKTVGENATKDVIKGKAAPTDLIATADGTTAKLEWKAATGTTPTDYKVQYRMLKEDGTWEADFGSAGVGTVDVAGAKVDVTGLQKDKTYEFRVCAVIDTADTGEMTATVNARV